MVRISVAALLLLVPACHASEQVETRDLASEIVSQWSMEEIYQDGRDVTQQHDPSDNRWIEFARDGTFISDGDPHGRNTGRWRLDEETQELHLDSDAGEDDDSYWVVSIASDTMRWQGARFEWNKRFELVHRRQ